MRKVLLMVGLLAGCLLVGGCKTTKNTGATRAYHGMLTHNLQIVG